MAQEWWLEAKPVTPSSAETEGVLLPVAPEKPREAPSGYRYGPTGTLEFIPGGPADPNAPKPDAKPSESQQKVGTLLTRILGGFKNIEAVRQRNPEAQQPGFGETLAENMFGEGIVSRKIAGADRRIVRDAQRDMLDALLTLGTGAAYNQEQLEGQTVAYFPQFGDTPEEINIKNAKLQRIIEAAKVAAGPQWSSVETAIAPFMPQSTEEPIAVGEAPPTRVSAIESGQPFVTEEDLARRDQVQAAWDRGATVEEIVALTKQLGLQPWSESDLQLFRNARENNLPLSFNPRATGEPSAVEGAIGPVVSTPVGESAAGYSIGALNALTGGFAVPEEIKQFTRETAPVSSFLGEATGAGIAAIPAIRGAQGILAGTRLAGAAPLIGESAYSALYGAGEAGEGNRLTGAALGGLGGLAGGALINRFLPGGPGTFTGAPRAPAAPTGRFGGAAATPEDIIVAGQQANIPVMTSDIMPPTTRMEQTLRNLGEVAPLGMGVPRVRQQAARQEAVENLLSDFGVTVDADIASDVVRNLNENRANMLSRFKSQKDGVINKFANAGDVPTTRSVAAIDKLLVDLRSENLPQLNSLIKDLEGVRDSLTGPGNLPKIEANRSTIFTLKGDPNLASISTKAENAFTAVYNALNDDMGECIKATGGNKDFALWKTANTQLAQMVGELKVGGLAGALKKGEFDPNIVTKMLVSSKPEEVRMLFRNLNREGRENARLLLIQEAGKRAFNSDTQMLNPDKFAREIGNLSDNFGKFFNASDMRRVQGLTDVLRATSRAQSARFLPQTGAQLLPFGAAGSLTAIIPGMGVMEGAAAATAFGVGRRFYESKFARDLLLRISQASGSKKAELINQFVAGATAATAARGAVGMAGAEEQ
jgi:hypothetical protein